MYRLLRPVQNGGILRLFRPIKNSSKDNLIIALVHKQMLNQGNTNSKTLPASVKNTTAASTNAVEKVDNCALQAETHVQAEGLDGITGENLSHSLAQSDTSIGKKHQNDTTAFYAS